MNKISVLFLLSVFFVASCQPSAATIQTSVAQTQAALPTGTLIPSTSTPEPTLTATKIPSPTFEPTITPTAIVYPQQWNGTFAYNNVGGKIQNISLLFEDINGTSFTGRMVWYPFFRFRGATLKITGEYITDFGDKVEQARWNNLEDYKNEVKGGVWLKWTETEIITGRNYTVNGWYYAHIREDGTMVAIYYFNKTEVIANTSVITLKQAQP